MNKAAPHTHYQVDYVAVNCGKIVAVSKRRIRFKYGYTNLEALSDGKTGQDCRGSEHDVIIIWSISSGKQSIMFDGKEVFFDVADTSKFQASFPDGRGHTLTVKAHAASMSTKSNPNPDWKQYDLLIDGVSYFKLPKIFEIGVVYQELEPSSPVPLAFRNKHQNQNEGEYFTYDSYRQMDSILPNDEAVVENKQPEPEPEPVVDLLSFDDDEPVAPLPAAPVQQNVQTYAPTQTDYSAQYSNQTYAPLQQQILQAPTTEQQNFAEAPIYNYPTQSNPFAPQDTMQPVTPPEAYSNRPVQNQPLYTNYQANVNPPAMPESRNDASPVTPTALALTMAPANPQSNDANGAVNSLVNIDNIFAPTPASAARQLNMQPTMNANNDEKKPVMNSFNPAVPPSYQQMQQQGLNNMYAQQQPQMQQQQYNNYSYQQNNFQQQQGYAQQQNYQQTGF